MILYISFSSKEVTAEAAYKEHDPIGQGLARDLMLCHKNALNAPPEGYIGTRSYTTLFFLH